MKRKTKTLAVVIVSMLIGALCAIPLLDQQGVADDPDIAIYEFASGGDSYSSPYHHHYLYSSICASTALYITDDMPLRIKVFLDDATTPFFVQEFVSEETANGMMYASWAGLVDTQVNYPSDYNYTFTVKVVQVDHLRDSAGELYEIEYSLENLDIPIHIPQVPAMPPLYP